MNYVTIKRRRVDGLVEMETYDTDTNAVSGLTMQAGDLWRWLWARRPCQVSLHGRSYSLEHPAARLERLVPFYR